MIGNTAGPQQDTQSRPRLENPPPVSKGSEGKRARTLMDAGSPGLGADNGNPQVMAMQGMQMAERGMQILAQSFPALQDPLSQVIAFLRQAVPQALSGGNPLQVPAAAPSPGGPPPMAPSPPGGGQMQGAPGAGL